ncbi:hypothetical protein [Parvibaculum sp.]|uniref:hypothetical protein n=1 Tax=Parvibaculum sp. TaxID=2024848 RepID=UPI0034A00E4C
MAHVIGHQELMKLEKTKSGDLVVFEYESSAALGIVFGHNEDGAPLIGILQSCYGAPRIYQGFGDKTCVTYGDDWTMEPIVSTLPSLDVVETDKHAGLLALSATGWLMNFMTSGADQYGRFTSQWRDMATFQLFQGATRRIARYEAWRLWAPASDRDRVGALPLLDYQARPPKSG